jgi:hypothetical protein
LYFLRDGGVGMGGCGNLKETSVKVNLKESGEAGELDVWEVVVPVVVEVRRLSSVGNTHESMRSETETVGCLCLALILSFEVPLALMTE